MALGCPNPIKSPITVSSSSHQHRRQRFLCHAEQPCKPTRCAPLICHGWKKPVPSPSPFYSTLMFHPGPSGWPRRGPIHDATTRQQRQRHLHAAGVAIIIICSAAALHCRSCHLAAHRTRRACNICAWSKRFLPLGQRQGGSYSLNCARTQRCSFVDSMASGTVLEKMRQLYVRAEVEVQAWAALQVRDALQTAGTSRAEPPSRAAAAAAAARRRRRLLVAASLPPLANRGAALTLASHRSNAYRCWAPLPTS